MDDIVKISDPNNPRVTATRAVCWSAWRGSRARPATPARLWRGSDALTRVLMKAGRRLDELVRDSSQSGPRGPARNGTRTDRRPPLEFWITVDRRRSTAIRPPAYHPET